MANVNSIYSDPVYARIRQKVKPDVLRATESSPELRREIAKIFQRANRRIQNIETAGLISPSVVALGKGDVQGYTKFSMRQSWDDLKNDYAKAVAFLRQPTSTAQGARQYGKHIQKMYNLTEGEYKVMAKRLNERVQSLSESEFAERYLFRYKDFTGDLERTAQDVSAQIESESISIERALENSLDESINNAVIEIESEQDGIQRIIDAFNNFGV